MGKPESDVELEKTLEAAAQIKWNKDYTENNTSVVFYCLGFYPAQLNMAALLCVPFFFFFFKPKWLNVLFFFYHLVHCDQQVLFKFLVLTITPAQDIH